MPGSLTTSTRTGLAPGSLSVSPGWAALAATSLVALAWWAPSGLVLLAYLAVVIVLHEAGHHLVARRVGMRPTEFFWGFGPEIVGVTIGDCRYGLKALFLGGYVKIEGMTPSSELPEGVEEAATYRAASIRGRLATILAGPTVNLATAVVAFVLAARLDGVGWASAVAQGGGDVVAVVRGTLDALWIWVANLEGYVRALGDTSGSTEAPVRFLSPVAQAEVSGWAVSQGPATALRWFAILSAAVGFINLLPLPPLDGAHAAVAAAEGTVNRLRPRRRVRLDASRLVPLAYVTLGVLVFLSVSALVLDLRDVT
ncbi:MAG: site-2 protease family protein [Actinomycetota bacterium]